MVRRCSIDSCNEFHYGRGFCYIHWSRDKYQRIKNTSKHLEYIKLHRQERIIYLKDYYQNNKDKMLLGCKKYRLDNLTELRIKSREYGRRQYKENPRWKMEALLRGRVLKALKRKGIAKTQRTTNLIGCSYKCLQQYIEKQFKDNMTWDNYGKKGWVIDHIKPCCSFDLIKEEEQKKCFHYTNLQPLWAEENQQKYTRVS